MCVATIMSVLEVHQNSALVGPRGNGQQIAAYKWVLETKNGYFLYIGAPATELSAETSRKTMLSPYMMGHMKTRVAFILECAEKLMAEGNPPESLKVWYSKMPWGDLSPSPQKPTVVGAGKKARPPTEHELLFCEICSVQLPMYDVTLRKEERSKNAAKQAFSNLFGGVQEVPLDLNTPVGKVPESFNTPPFSTWGRKSAQAVGNDITSLISFGTPNKAVSGVITFTSPSKESVSAPFGKYCAFAIRNDIPNTNNQNTLFNKFMFFTSGSFIDKLTGPIAIVTMTADQPHMVEVRMPDKTLKRLCFDATVTVSLDTKPDSAVVGSSAVGPPASGKQLAGDILWGFLFVCFAIPGIVAIGTPVVLITWIVAGNEGVSNLGNHLGM